MNGFSQENLVFLISQPRAGSTLTQRILGGHPDIYTVSEPWIMLHPLYALREQGCYMEYSADNSRKALHNFLSLHPQGEEAYFRTLRQMCLNLYGEVLQPSGKRYFLDKTPRYYYIISDLYRTFPDAKYIFLLRNPLAVLCSIFSTFVGQKWWTIQYYQSDLLRAPSLIAQGMLDLQNRSIVLRYEDLLTNPENEIHRVCSFLNVPCDTEIIHYGEQCSEKWQFGDQARIHQEKKPNSQNSDRWQQDLQDPLIWQSVHHYLEFLGKDLLGQLGYAYDDLKDLIETQSPQIETSLPPALEDFFASAHLFLDNSLQPLLGIVESAPQLFQTYLDLGKSLLQKDDIHLGLNYLQKALHLAPFVPEIHDAIGQGLFRLGKLEPNHQLMENAIAAFRRAIELDPTLVGAYESLANAYIQIEQLDNAILILKQALQLNSPQSSITALLKTIAIIEEKRI